MIDISLVAQSIFERNNVELQQMKMNFDNLVVQFIVSLY